MKDAPTKLSANGEHGFPVAEDSATVRVFLDGDVKRLVFAYDCDEGWVESPILNERGECQALDGEWLYKREHGKITAFIIG